MGTEVAAQHVGLRCCQHPLHRLFFLLLLFPYTPGVASAVFQHCIPILSYPAVNQQLDSSFMPEINRLFRVYLQAPFILPLVVITNLNTALCTTVLQKILD